LFNQIKENFCLYIYIYKTRVFLDLIEQLSNFYASVFHTTIYFGAGLVTGMRTTVTQGKLSY